MDGGGTAYRGTSMDQDGRFSNKDKKLMKQMTWPPEFSTKVDIKKVDLTVINPWIHKRIIEYLGDEDELLINFIISALEQPTEKGLDPRKMQIDLTGFLAKSTGPFMKELWQLLIDAQNSPNGIPPVLIEERKDEIKQQRQDIEDELSKLENIKAFMGGNKENTSSRRNEEGIESGRRKEDLSRIANKLKAEKGPSAEKEERQKEVEKPREKYREDRDRRRDRDDRGDRDRLREKDRRRDKERERERERDRDRERDRRRDRERERERRRSPRHERSRRSKRSPSSSSGSSSSESRGRSESPSKKQKREKRDDNKQKEKEKQKSRNKKHESSSESESDSGSDSSSDSDSSQSDSSGSDSDNGKK